MSSEKAAHRCGRRVHDGRTDGDLPKERELKMFKQMIRWIVPVVALLLIATALLLAPAITSIHAASSHTHTTTTTAKTTTPTSTPSTGGVMTPSFLYGH